MMAHQEPRIILDVDNEEGQAIPLRYIYSKPTLVSASAYLLTLTDG